MRLAKCLWLTASLLSSPPNQATAQMAGTPQIGQILSRAAALSKQGDFDGAAEAYRQAIHISPNDPMICLYLGLALENKGSYPEAAKAYDDAIALQQKRSDMPSLLAHLYAHASAAYLLTNHLDEANARADKSLQLNPNSADALSTKGVILDMQGHLDEAIEYDRKASAIDPRSPIFAANLAGVLQKKGDAQGAVAVVQTSLKSNPHDSELLAAYGNALLAANHPAEAETAYRSSLAERVDNSSVLYNLADALRRQKKLSASLELLQKAHGLAPNDPDISLSLGSLLVELGRTQEAYPHLASARQSGKYDALSSYAMANALQRDSHPQEALGFVEDALGSKQDFPQAIALQIVVLLDLDRVQEATKILTPAVEAHPQSAELKNSEGLVALRQNNVKQAEVYFQHSLALKPDYTDALVNHAISLMLLKRSAEALPEFNQALLADPKNLKAQSSLAQALFDLGHFTEASDAYARAIDISPGSPNLHTNRGLALEKAGRLDEAKKEFEEAKRLVASGDKPPATALK